MRVNEPIFSESAKDFVKEILNRSLIGIGYVIPGSFVSVFVAAFVSGLYHGLTRTKLHGLDNLYWIVFLFVELLFFITPILEFITSEKYPELKTKWIQQAFKKEIEELEETLRRNSYQKEAQIEKVKKEVERIIGIPFSDFVQILDSREETNWNYSKFRSRAQIYLSKIREKQNYLNSVRYQKPIVSTVATMLGEQFEEITGEGKKRFLDRERELCQKVARENEIILSPAMFKGKLEVDLVRVIDGDTMLVTVKSTGDSYRVRIIGFDSPETVHPKKDVMHWGPESSKFADDLCKNARKFEIRLDSVASKQSWNNDRHGRLLAHFYIDDVLFGKRMLETGNAEVLDVFPMEEDIKELYRISELDAKINNRGLWLELNKLEEKRKLIRRKHKFEKITEIIETQQEVYDIKKIMHTNLQDLVKRMMVKSKKSIVVHEISCHHAAKINSGRNAENVSSEIIDGTNFVNCKVCNGDPLINELYNR